MLSLREVLGPIMIGPSSSHTAGAVKLAKTAKMIVGQDFKEIKFGLGGSFGATYKGHFTDLALVAGSLGFSETDERIRDSFNIAKQKNLKYVFRPENIENGYDNTVRFTYTLLDDSKYFIEGASLGGGRILITNINGIECGISAKYHSIIVKHLDAKGVISAITKTLTEDNINIAQMMVNRNSKGREAFTIIECDHKIPKEVKFDIERIDNILSVVVIEIDD